MSEQNTRKNKALWDRLAGTLVAYIQNEMCEGIRKNDKLSTFEQFKPFGEYLGNISETGIYTINADTIGEIMHADDINGLNSEIQKIVLWHLPRFLKEWPEYKDAECLKVRG